MYILSKWSVYMYMQFLSYTFFLSVLLSVSNMKICLWGVFLPTGLGKGLSNVRSVFRLVPATWLDLKDWIWKKKNFLRIQESLLLIATCAAYFSYIKTRLLPKWKRLRREEQPSDMNGQSCKCSCFNETLCISCNYCSIN